MRHKGGERVVRVCSKVRPKGLVGNTTMDLFVIDDSETLILDSRVVAFEEGVY